MCCIIQVGWSSVKEYYTFSWALAPEGYIEATNVNCCVHFQGRNKSNKVCTGNQGPFIIPMFSKMYVIFKYSIFWYKMLSVPAFYLPHPSEVEYQFVYVDENGKICGCSRQFTFCAPKPLDELETLEEERDGDEEGDGEMEDLLLVVPRAQLLQVGTWRTAQAHSPDPGGPSPNQTSLQVIHQSGSCQD